MKKWFAKVKNNMKERLEKFAEENRKIHHGQRLDCCSGSKRPVVKVKRY
jgi:hypothetical protein